MLKNGETLVSSAFFFAMVTKLKEKTQNWWEKWYLVTFFSMSNSGGTHLFIFLQRAEIYYICFIVKG